MSVSFNTIIEEFRSRATSNYDAGHRFELLMLKYLRADPIYYERFSDAWMWIEKLRENRDILLVTREVRKSGKCGEIKSGCHSSSPLTKAG